jgi:hypothetical protein
VLVVRAAAWVGVLARALLGGWLAVKFFVVVGWVGGLVLWLGKAWLLVGVELA